MSKILILEDEEMVSDILELMMQSYQKTVDSFSNPVEALKNYKKGKYDAIISDLDLPEMNGFQFIREIRKIDKNIPIILCSGYISEYIDLYKLKEELNIGAIFGKPLKVDKLNSVLDTLIDKE